MTTREPIKDSALLTTVSGLVTDLADLFRKEVRLAKAELTANLSLKVQAGAWMGGAALLGLVALIFVLQAVVFALVSAGMQAHWACLLVALVLAGLAAFAFFRGRTDAAKGVLPQRAVRQVMEDVKVTKEQLL